MLEGLDSPDRKVYLMGILGLCSGIGQAPMLEQLLPQ